MKIITMSFVLYLSIPFFLNAQYSGGNGSGDVSDSLTNAHIIIQKISTELPTKYELSQNYPNPFNPTTKIKYQITNNKLVRLQVFDILGKSIKSLVDELQSAGTYEVCFDASDLPSGIYFYKLDTDSYSDTKQMTVLK